MIGYLGKMRLTSGSVQMSVMYAQNTEWINYTNGIGVHATVLEGDNIWIGTFEGWLNLIKQQERELI